MHGIIRQISLESSINTFNKIKGIWFEAEFQTFVFDLNSVKTREQIGSA